MHSFKLKDSFSENNRVLTFVLTSIVLHIFIFLISTFDLFKSELVSIPKEEKKYIEVSLERPLPSMIKQKKSVTKKRPKQIVNNTQLGLDQKPKDSRFLGEKNQTFAKQTRAKRIDKFNRGAKGKTLKKSGSKKTKDLMNLSDLSMNSYGKQLMDSSIKNNIRKQKQEHEQEASEKLGSEFGLEGSKGMASNNDYIEDIPLGETTQLNTMEYKFYGFYHRVRQRLEQHWGRSIREKTRRLYRRGKNITSNRSYITSLTIVMNAKGKIIEVVVNGKSGIEELDQAAVESFNKAGPFPNPPPGMVKNGRVIINWGFVVKS